MGWKKVIVSGSSADLLNVSASAGFKGNLVGNVTGTATQVGNSLTVDDSTIQLNSGTTYDGSGARTISVKNSGITLAKIANQANNTVLGNVSGGAAAPSALTATNLRTLINVEDGADVTDATNVTAAGALMDSEVTDLGLVKGLTKAGISGSLSNTALAALGAGIVSSSAQVSSLAGTNDSTITLTAGDGLSGGGSFTLNQSGAGSVSFAVGVDDSTIELSSDAVRIKDSGVTLAKIANQANNTILGNVSGGAAAPSALTATNVRTLINVEDGADVTDATNVTAAGALMDSEVTNLAFVKGLTAGISDGNVLTANDAVSDDDFLRINGTEVEGLTAAQVRTAINVEDGADVTDTTNVTAAGALMDSELTNLAAVKAIDQGLATGNNVAFANLTLSGDLVVNGTTTTLNTTNLNVEDQFILVNSGSTAKDAGLIFGGTSGTAQQGKALIWDYSYNGNDGRLAISTTDVAHDSTSNFGGGTAGYYVAGVFAGSDTDAATAKADHAGNIRIESNEIYIYV